MISQDARLTNKGSGYVLQPGYTVPRTLALWINL